MLSPSQQSGVSHITDSYNSAVLSFIPLCLVPSLVTTWKLLTTHTSFVSFLAWLSYCIPPLFKYSNFCLSNEEGKEFCHTDKHCNNIVLLVTAIFL